MSNQPEADKPAVPPSAEQETVFSPPRPPGAPAPPALAAKLASGSVTPHVSVHSLAGSGEPGGPPELPRDGRIIGGYVLMEEVGRGGVGVVYRAWQKSLKRCVALKMIIAGQHSRADVRARFRAEAEIAAQVHHPNVVQIYEIGEHEALPFFSLEYLEGSNLARRIDGMPIPPREAARLCRDIAYGASAAHQQGLIHRDLKPANILMTRDGIPKITDFGLAKNLEVQSNTISGTILGTPNYMAPEQAAGSKHVGPAADIYSIGAILYEMLTGRPPFRGETVTDTLMQVRSREPAAPSLLQPDVPRDLELICMTCLRKPPEQRYASAQALAEDLQAFLVGDPIAARPESLGGRIRRLFQESPLAIFITAAAGCAVVGLAIGAWLSDPRLSGVCAALGAVVCGAWLYSRLRERLRESHFSQLAAERTVERLHFVLERIGQLVATRDLDSILRLLAETARYLVNAQHATVYLIDHERREIWSRVLLDESLSEIRLPFGSGIAGTVAATGETVNLADAYDDPRFNREYDAKSGRRTRSLLTVAMKDRDGRPIGVFQLMNKRTGSFTRDDIALLSWLKEAALVAVQNARQEAAARDKQQAARSTHGERPT